MESPSKVDDEQWLSYWIIYSFITLLEMLAEPLLYWIPVWYPVKLLFVAWLVLPQFKGASFVYEKLVREQLSKYRARYPPKAKGGAADVVDDDDDHKVHIAKVGKQHSDEAVMFNSRFQVYAVTVFCSTPRVLTCGVFFLLLGAGQKNARLSTTMCSESATTTGADQRSEELL
jgi:receptor expression-enhancing protein 5/6